MTSCSSSSSSSSCCPALSVLPPFDRDVELGKDLITFLENSKKGCSRKYVRFQGEHLFVEFSETRMFNPICLHMKDNEEEGVVPVLNMVKIGVDVDQWEEKGTIRGQGTFKAFMAWFVPILRQKRNFQYMRVECINNKRLLNHLMKRTDIVHEDLGDNRHIWIDLSSDPIRSSPTLYFLKDGQVTSASSLEEKMKQQKKEEENTTIEQ